MSRIEIREKMSVIVDGEKKEVMRVSRYSNNNKKHNTSIKAFRRRNYEPWEEVDSYHLEAEKVDNWASYEVERAYNELSSDVESKNKEENE